MIKPLGGIDLCEPIIHMHLVDYTFIRIVVMFLNVFLDVFCLLCFCLHLLYFDHQPSPPCGILNVLEE